MFKNQVIRKIVAGFMLTVFAVGITPAVVFHNWFAKHTDSVKIKTDNKTDQIGEPVASCNCNQLVAAMPFTDPAIKIYIVSPLIYSYLRFDNRVKFISSQPVLRSLRGPPAV